MRHALTALGLTILAAIFVACGARVNRTIPPAAQNQGAAVKITAEQLAQEFSDGTAGATYGLQMLELTGTATRLEKPKAWEVEPGPDDFTDAVVFIVPVTHKETGKKVDYVIRCGLQPQVSPADRKAVGLEKGKKVVLRGKILAADLNNPQASLQGCTIVSAGGQ